MQDNIIYQIGSLKIKMNRRIEHFDKIYSISFAGEYDWFFEVIESRKILNDMMYKAEETGDRGNIIYINDDCIYEMDVSKRKSICYCADVCEFEISLIGAPIQVVALNSNKVCLHGSGIINNNEIIVFSGNSGVGKSTLMNYLIEEGFEFFCDDICLFERKENVNTVHCIEGYVKLYEEQIDNTNDYIKANGTKYFVPIEKNRTIKRFKRIPYKLNRMLFLSRNESKNFTIKTISDPSLKYILCVQGIIFFNEDTPLISDDIRRSAIDLIKDIDMEVLYIPNELENYDIDSIRKTFAYIKKRS